MRYEKNWKYRNETKEGFFLGADFALTPGKIPECITTHMDNSTNVLTLWIHRGYRWNGLSWVPDFFDSEHNMRASLIHDVLYDMIRRGAIPYKQRKYADRLFRRILKKDGQGLISRSLMYFFVRWFAGFACKPKGA